MSPQDQGILHLIQASNISLPKQQVQQFFLAHKTNLEIQKPATESKLELKRQKMQPSSQGILYRIEDGHEQMLVLQFLKENTMEEHHNAPVIKHVGVQRIVNHIKRDFWWQGLWGDVG